MSALIAALSACLPVARVITDPLRRLAYGTDASFYRLTPEAVAIVRTEDEVRAVLAVCRQHQRPTTFRAAGTSLSGQAVTDGVLVLLGDGWDQCEIREQGATVRLGPGLVGAEANRRLAPFGRKIGPDPASINACKIGGIAANNASGMCCGTAQNSYRTVRGMRVVFADGAILDTEEPASRDAFKGSHGALLAQLEELARQTRDNGALADKIRRKFKIKNTTGYSLNALVDYSDPIDILTHLMIGSEGTLGFISRITYATVPEHAHKASALILFHDMETACRAVTRLKPEPVSAVEIMDRAAIRSVEDKPGMPEGLAGLPADAAALLVEVRGESAVQLAERIQHIEGVLADFPVVATAHFYTDAPSCDKLWKIRKGMFPSVGAIRAAGTTVIIEDVAFPVERLAEATLDLQALFLKHGYHEAIIFGHALEGNLHFVFTQDFGHESEVQRYAHFMDDVCHLVVDKYEGSLKAEHGTGRNVAPFVELEWGREAAELMWRIKGLFDPDGLLNPGVILNADPQAHLKDLKPLPAADDIIDKCIECGFCEPQCPSAGLTFSPRQRIVGWREISRRHTGGEETAHLRATYAYQGMETCAGCGLCAEVCPVGIETGALIRNLRGREATAFSRRLAEASARNFGSVTKLARLGLAAGHAAEKLLGHETMAKLTGGGWRAAMPRPASNHAVAAVENGEPLVYFPTCTSRVLGPADGESTAASLPETAQTVFARAGYRPIIPSGLAGLCCGQPWESKGQTDLADEKSRELEAALLAASDNGRLPIVFDNASCAWRMKRFLGSRLKITDIAEFAADSLLSRLPLKRKTVPIALHVNCSSRKMGLEAPLNRVAAACSDKVVLPDAVKCCGFGGDRGFRVKELNEHALRTLPTALPVDCTEGYSSNRTCEIGLSSQSGIAYRSIIYLLEECSREETTTSSR